MAAQITPATKMTDLRIQRALAKPGAVGMKGFLLWLEAAWPKAIAAPVLAAAAKYTPGAGPLVTLASPAAGGFGHMHPMPMGHMHPMMGRFGDISADLTAVPDSVSSAISSAATDPTVPPVSGVTAATQSQPASAGWLSDIGNAITAATTAALGVTQVNDAQKIFNINLARAQQGLAPIATNPAALGLPSPTARIGLTSETTTAVLWGVGLLAGGLILAGALGGRKGRK
jgi:hypothetical protein